MKFGLTISWILPGRGTVFDWDIAKCRLDIEWSIKPFNPVRSKCPSPPEVFFIHLLSKKVSLDGSYSLGVARKIIIGRLNPNRRLNSNGLAQKNNSMVSYS